MTATTRQRRSPLGLFPDNPSPRLYDRIVDVLRVRHYSRRTEEAYIHWIRRYIEFYQHQHPRQLADDQGGQRPRDDVPRAVIRSLQEHLRRVEAIDQQDLADGYGRIELPHARARKYPNANREWGWQFVFPQERRWRNSRTGEQGRYHIDESLFSRSLKAAVRKAGLTKRVTSHTFRHSFATHLLADGYDIRTVEELLGHKDVRTTMIYTHVLNRGGRAVRSPADGLARDRDER